MKASNLLIAIALLAGSAPAGEERERAGSLREILEEFRKISEPNEELLSKGRALRDRFAKGLEELAPREEADPAYVAAFPHYLTALYVMDEIMLLAMDYRVANQDKERELCRVGYEIYQGQLELMAEEIDRLEKELGW